MTKKSSVAKKKEKIEQLVVLALTKSSNESFYIWDYSFNSLPLNLQQLIREIWGIV